MTGAIPNCTKLAMTKTDQPNGAPVLTLGTAADAATGLCGITFDWSFTVEIPFSLSGRTQLSVVDTQGHVLWQGGVRGK